MRGLEEGSIGAGAFDGRQQLSPKLTLLSSGGLAGHPQLLTSFLLRRCATRLCVPPLLHFPLPEWLPLHMKLR